MQLPTPVKAAALRRVHLVDKCLLLLMLVLLAQSAYSLFFPGAAGQIAGDIDIVVRTSTAAIFGYFLSANFIRHTSTAGQAPAEETARILEVGAGQTVDASAPKAQIGFTADVAQTQAETVTGGAAAQTAADSIADSTSDTSLQITVATAIGLFCLAALLVLRNLDQLGVLPIQSAAVSATVTQFRDFVSGCVGFLIGCPTQQTDATSQ